jgi:hypothetical protein
MTGETGMTSTEGIWPGDQIPFCFAAGSMIPIVFCSLSTEQSID